METATLADDDSLIEIPVYEAIELEGLWRDALTLLETESDPAFGDYLEGELQSVERWLTHLVCT